MKPDPILAELHDLYHKHEVVCQRHDKNSPWEPYGFCHTCGRPLYWSASQKEWMPLSYQTCLDVAKKYPKKKKYWLRVAKGAKDAPL